MKIGFTGTRDGMTPDQQIVFRKLVEDLAPTEFHHGMCWGADTVASEIVRGFTDATIIGHPAHPHNLTHGSEYDEARRFTRDYLTRNRDIVRETNVLIATPKESNQILRSGTWATVRFKRRYMEKNGGSLIIILPDGRIAEL